MSSSFRTRTFARGSIVLCSLLALTACGGDDTPPIPDAGTHDDLGTHDDAGTHDDLGAHDDAGTPDDASTPSDARTPDDASASDAGGACATAIDGGACTIAGTVCGGPCTDRCSFCNILRCEGGMWTHLEVFPDPTCATTFPCDTGGLRCDRDTEHCRIARSDVVGEPDVIRCEPMPSTCSAATCACFPAGAGMTCSDDADGGVTVTYLGG